MPKQICEISASSWFYSKEICYDVRSHERKTLIIDLGARTVMLFLMTPLGLRKCRQTATCHSCL